MPSFSKIDSEPCRRSGFTESFGWASDGIRTTINHSVASGITQERHISLSVNLQHTY